MGILTMFGLMRVEDHKAETNRLNLKLAKQGNALSEAKAEARKATDVLGKVLKDYGTRGDLLASARKERDESEAKFKTAAKDLEQQSVEINRLTSGWEKANADNALLRRQLDDSERELSFLRPDAEWARARKAKAAEYEANKRVRKAKGAGK